MDPTLKVVALLMMLHGLVGIVSATSTDFNHCEKVVKDWALSSLAKEAKSEKHTLRDLLFFLHIPRTGGRTYFHCFLRKLYSSSEECPRSYDKLRFDPGKQRCRLLVSHDDFTMMSKLPEEKTSVVTILRNPVDRVFSTYEFSVEVAARFLVHPNLTSATQMTGRLRSKGVGVSTLDIWPWKYLVPWMRHDLFARRDARKLKGSTNFMTSDPYNMKEMVMPLQEYINDPIAHDIVHNGATFQITGLTNNSNFAESHEVRRCVQKHKQLGEYVLLVAKKRLDEMLYVGLTENHKESATIFAHVVGAQVISQALEANSSVESAIDDKSANSSSILDTEPDADDNHINALDQVASGNASTEIPGSKKENLTVEKLMDSYEECISNLRKTQARRRSASLKRIAPANFSKEDRNRVSGNVVNHIELLNNLDLELYHYAVELFTKQHERMVQKLEEPPTVVTNSGSVTLWGVLILVTLFVLVLVIYLYVNSSRKRSKLKI